MQSRYVVSVLLLATCSLVTGQVCTVSRENVNTVYEGQPGYSENKYPISYQGAIDRDGTCGTRESCSSSGGSPFSHWKCASGQYCCMTHVPCRQDPAAPIGHECTTDTYCASVNKEFDPPAANPEYWRCPGNDNVRCCRPGATPTPTFPPTNPPTPPVAPSPNSAPTPKTAPTPPPSPKAPTPPTPPSPPPTPPTPPTVPTPLPTYGVPAPLATYPPGQPQNCIVQWGPWGGCNGICKDAETPTRTRYRTVIVEARSGGTACPSESETQECTWLPDCSAFTPPNQDCELGPWTSYTECMAPCDQPGIKLRRRLIITPASGTGEKCGPQEEEVDCTGAMLCDAASSGSFQPREKSNSICDGARDACGVCNGDGSTCKKADGDDTLVTGLIIGGIACAVYCCCIIAFGCLTYWGRQGNEDESAVAGMDVLGGESTGNEFGGGYGNTAYPNTMQSGYGYQQPGYNTQGYGY